MALCFQLIASGSKGNAILVCSPKTRILVDAGLSARELCKRLEKTCTPANRLDALVLSHEHGDHVRGAGVLSRRFHVPVYLNQGTRENLPEQTGPMESMQIFQSGSPFSVGDLEIHPFSISHDAADPVGFVVEHNAVRLGICTDLGVATQLVRTRLRGCRGIVLEANHDTDLLLNGPYPWELKQRIRGRHGHLSNSDAYELLDTLHHDRLKTVVFAHLSEVNNHPDLVRTGSNRFFCRDSWRDVDFVIGKQHEISGEMELA
ncbi:MAG TPA: MBL fold metallo-hydrolase [Syntrophobacteraceae bacterium]|nr:MBL fold metallo-hydrolase [Syntrophobacteraceae bacterium]